MPKPIGHCIALPDCQLPFDSIQTWSKMHIQSRKYHWPHDVAEAQTVMAAPSSTEWPLGKFDVIIANLDHEQQWPQSSLVGKSSLLVLYSYILFLIKL